MRGNGEKKLFFCYSSSSTFYSPFSHYRQQLFQNYGTEYWRAEIVVHNICRFWSFQQLKTAIRQTTSSQTHFSLSRFLSFSFSLSLFWKCFNLFLFIVVVVTLFGFVDAHKIQMKFSNRKFILFSYPKHFTIYTFQLLVDLRLINTYHSNGFQTMWVSKCTFTMDLKLVNLFFLLLLLLNLILLSKMTFAGYLLNMVGR